MAHSLIHSRLQQLRKLMKQHGADYYWIPAADPHKNEYVPEHWLRRQFISGFTGSTGDVLVADKQAYLWTDPRYFLQAEQQLDPQLFQLMKINQGGTPPLDQWLIQQRAGFCLAVDPQVISIAQAERLLAAADSKQGKILFLEPNLIDEIWSDQPPLPQSTIQLFPLKYSGQEAQEKLNAVRQKLSQHNTNALVLNTLDAIAWLFNIRGDDIHFNPLVISYAIITLNDAQLFVDQSKLTAESENYFSQQHIATRPYHDFQTALQDLTGKVWLDPNSSNYWIKQQLANATLHYQLSPIARMKAIKNSTEQRGMQQAHIFDALAMIKFFYWLENHWRQGVTELSAALKLNAFRLEHPDCLDLSFTTISGFGPHGAIVHYSVTAESDIPIDDSSLYLVDSGGQYRMGTTDITRTIHLGQPTAQQKQHYTLVLQGHLNIRHIIFPDGTCGEHINALAHAPLWRQALDYGHGTGHGVGCYSCVHEAPPTITARITNEPFKPGMVVSNEPGLYLTNQYGIRIENLCLCQEIFTTAQSLPDCGPFYGFEDLTLVPYCRQLIATEQLNADEIAAVNAYHQRIFMTLKPYLSEELKSWLQQATAPL